MRFHLPFTQFPTGLTFVGTPLLAVVLTVRLNLLEFEGNSVLGGLVKFLHLGSFSTLLGVQVWVSFFAGITMFHNLPRHTFGYIQTKLLPKYFLLGTILSSVSLLTYVLHNPLSTWRRQQMIQGWALLLSVLMALSNMFYLEPQTTKYTIMKQKYEKEASVCQPVDVHASGLVVGGKLVKQLRDKPEYVAMMKRFVALHTLMKRFVALHTLSITAILVSLAAQAIHLWYLSHHL